MVQLGNMAFNARQLMPCDDENMKGSLWHRKKNRVLRISWNCSSAECFGEFFTCGCIGENMPRSVFPCEKWMVFFAYAANAFGIWNKLIWKGCFDIYCCCWCFSSYCGLLLLLHSTKSHGGRQKLLGRGEAMKIALRDWRGYNFMQFVTFSIENIVKQLHIREK